MNTDELHEYIYAPYGAGASGTGYTMLQAALGPQHPWVARTMDSLGRVLLDQGDLDGARMHLERALAIDEATIGANHPQVSGILDRLGRVLHQQGDLDGARAHLERALGIAETTVGPNHHWVGGTLDNLGQVLRDQGDLAAARACLTRAHTILQIDLGADHHDTQAVARRLESLDSLLGSNWRLTCPALPELRNEAVRAGLLLQAVRAPHRLRPPPQPAPPTGRQQL
jgi:tetratricopeptide (TPR) repeat protein